MTQVVRYKRLATKILGRYVGSLFSVLSEGSIFRKAKGLRFFYRSQGLTRAQATERNEFSRPNMGGDHAPATANLHRQSASRLPFRRRPRAPPASSGASVPRHAPS